MDLNWQNACLACTENSVWFPGPQQTIVVLFRAQDPCRAEGGVEAGKSTEALRIMAIALPEPELCTLADSTGAQWLEAIHLCCCCSGVTIKTASLMLQMYPLLCRNQTDGK